METWFGVLAPSAPEGKLISVDWVKSQFRITRDESEPLITSNLAACILRPLVGTSNVEIISHAKSPLNFSFVMRSWI